MWSKHEQTYLTDRSGKSAEMDDEVDDILAELDGDDIAKCPRSEADPYHVGQPRKKQGGHSWLQTALQQVRDGAEVLNLSPWSVRIGLDGSIALAESIRQPHLKLTTVLLNCNDIGPKGSAVLADALNVNASITKLDLSGNAISDLGATSLSDALRRNTTLKVLDLEDNGIGPTGASALADGLKVNRALESLHLAENLIADTGATAFACCLSTNNTLRTLWLAGNKIGLSGGTSLSSSLSSNTALKTLYLGTPRIGSTIHVY